MPFVHNYRQLFVRRKTGMIAEPSNRDGGNQGSVEASGGNCSLLNPTTGDHDFLMIVEAPSGTDLILFTF